MGNQSKEKRKGRPPPPPPPGHSQGLAGGLFGVGSRCPRTSQPSWSPGSTEVTVLTASPVLSRLHHVPCLLSAESFESLQKPLMRLSAIIPLAKVAKGEITCVSCAAGRENVQRADGPLSPCCESTHGAYSPWHKDSSSHPHPTPETNMA